VSFYALIRAFSLGTIRKMTNTRDTTLVIGGTGKTGSRIAARLTALGLPVRTAARDGGDVHFEWDDPSTHQQALDGASRLYLMAPVMRTTFAPRLSALLDLAEAAGVRHVTYLSMYGMDSAPAELGHRVVEQDLIARSSMTHSILRPAWFMQNFSEGFLYPLDGAVVVPTGSGSEAFVDVDDIAAVATATLADPDAHAGAAYAPTGPEALTVSEAAEIIAAVSGRAVRHVDIDREAWIEGMRAAGVPAEYDPMLRFLTETVASGAGSTPNNDVERVTGAPPRSFADFARRNAAAWTEK
jgi:uncharacterized protein YbjT (DUF2867 family)